MADNMPTKFKSGKAVGAMLGAACGDALGWPNERVGKSKAPQQPQGRLHEFRRWTRRSGGRFFPHEEIIEAGEYSDDTQLILCLSRSLLKGERWFEFYTQVELPFWSLYERGGGGATKRAVDSWQNGIEPWNRNRKPQDVKRYFDAGGNGVAMRALPHALYLCDEDFDKVANSIFMDGLTTHGHPRALLGALVYGYALWASLRKEAKLGYGELIEEIIANEAAWSPIPSQGKFSKEWLAQAQKHLKDYKKLWLSTKEEILKYLDICKSELSRGALSFDDDALEKLQCFNKQISGAGTVAAIASVYLASRYAADPINGVIKAAFAIGSDTDTIASMAGGLLGCINGSDWLSSVKSRIQDYSYLEKTALKLSTRQTDEPSEIPPVRSNKLKRWLDNVVADKTSNYVALPNGIKATIEDREVQIGRNGKYKIDFLRLITTEGQRIYIHKKSRGSYNINQKELPFEQQSNALVFGPKLTVTSFEKSVNFYKDLLGLSIKRQSNDLVVFNEGLVLIKRGYTNSFVDTEYKSILYIEKKNINSIYSKSIAIGVKIVTHLEIWGKTTRKYFRCLDNDDNLIEIFEPK